ncbi:hypothetical protein MMC34_001571 [Xylographa carneopallida]|nr:hypothetical protein [Xylographa carneopallida]
MFRYLREKSFNFSPLPQAEDQKALISESETVEALDLSTRTIPSRLPKALLFALSLPVATLLGAWLGSQWRSDVDSFCINHVSQSSPITKDLDIRYNIVAFNGSLLKENLFRQNAGPEVDTAWKSLGVDYRSAIVPADLAQQAGLSPNHVQVSEKYGGGFPTNVEGLHHLHCLNLLRQSLYYNYDYYHSRGEDAFKNSDAILRFHVSHCLDILRQQLMCSVDIAVLGQVWWDKAAPKAYPDFNTRHRCRNFDAVRRWAEARQAPEGVPEDYLQPPASLEDVYAAMP